MDVQLHRPHRPDVGQRLGQRVGRQVGSGNVDEGAVVGDAETRPVGVLKLPLGFAPVPAHTRPQSGDGPGVVDDEVEVLHHRGHAWGHFDVGSPSAQLRVAVGVQHQGRLPVDQRAGVAPFGHVATSDVLELEAGVEGGDGLRALGGRNFGVPGPAGSLFGTGHIRHVGHLGVEPDRRGHHRHVSGVGPQKRRVGDRPAIDGAGARRPGAFAAQRRVEQAFDGRWGRHRGCGRRQRWCGVRTAGCSHGELVGVNLVVGQLRWGVQPLLEAVDQRAHAVVAHPIAGSGGDGCRPGLGEVAGARPAGRREASEQKDC